MPPRRPPRSSRRSHERWLVSYADFITLLFAFFTTLYAISTVDTRKLEMAAGSMSDAFDQGGSTPRVLAGAGQPLPFGLGAAEASDRQLRDLQEQLSTRLGAEISRGHVELELDPRGLVVSMQEAGSFATGSADLSEPARRMLMEVAETLRGVPRPARIEGHTDDVPISTPRFRSNWELSTARATAVIVFLVEHAGLSPAQLSAAGYGEYRPRVPNDSADNRGRNRRVDLIILRNGPDASPSIPPVSR